MQGEWQWEDRVQLGCFYFSMKYNERPSAKNDGKEEMWEVKSEKRD